MQIFKNFLHNKAHNDLVSYATFNKIFSSLIAMVTGLVSKRVSQIAVLGMNFFIFVLGFLVLGNVVVNCRKVGRQEWGGVLSFKDDFDGFDVNKDFWNYDEWCNGKGRKDKNLECFVKSDDNLRVINGTLVIRALPLNKPLADKHLYGKTKNYTSARLRSIDTFLYGTYVISARMPKGKGLLPSIWLVSGHQEANCKYQEIEIATGHKTSNIMFSASYGRTWKEVVTKRMEKVFPGVDFSETFHEYALKWKPHRMDWYVDRILIYSVPTYYHSDWILSDESNMPCSKNKDLFQEPLQLTLSMAVGGSMFEYESPLTTHEAKKWTKPTFEIDWVKVYQV